MALVWGDGFDAYAAANLSQRYQTLQGGSLTLGSPGRLGYGNYLSCGGASYPIQSNIGGPLTTVIMGAAIYLPGASLSPFSAGGAGMIFFDSLSNQLCTVQVGPLGQIGFCVGTSNTPSYQTSTGIFFAQTWAYLEVQVTLSSGSTGSVTIRLNGLTVLSQGSITTAVNGNGCSGVGLGGIASGTSYWDDWYVLNSTSPNNAFFGDVKLFVLLPAGNGRVDGMSRFGGTSSGNYTAVNEVPPDGDSSYTYTAVAGTEDCYTLTALSNITTIKAVQLSALARKDDTPSRTLALGVGNGTTENFNAGVPLNTTYTYITRPLDTNPLTSAAWAVADFSTLQLAQELIS